MALVADFLLRIDRRWVFLLIGLAVIYPIIFPSEFPEVPSTPVKDAYAQLDQLKPGDRVLMAFDYDPASAAEIQPMATAMTWHAAKKGLKIYFISLWPLGPQMIQDTISDVLSTDFPDHLYGEDYVNLGFRPGQEAVIKLITSDLKVLFNTDHLGTSTSEIPMTQSIASIKQMDLVVNISAGSPGSKEWVQYACTPNNIPIVVGCTGVQAPLLYPYYPNQMQGLLGAIKAASEYEELVTRNFPEYTIDPETGVKRAAFTKGRQRMGPQLIAHILILLLIILGNVILLLQRWQPRRGA